MSSYSISLRADGMLSQRSAEADPVMSESVFTVLLQTTRRSPTAALENSSMDLFDVAVGWRAVWQAGGGVGRQELASQTFHPPLSRFAIPRGIPARYTGCSSLEV